MRACLATALQVLCTRPKLAGLCLGGWAGRYSVQSTTMHCLTVSRYLSWYQRAVCLNVESGRSSPLEVEHHISATNTANHNKDGT